MLKNLITFLSLSLMFFIAPAQTDITVPELKAHIAFLTSDKNAGRYPGGHLNRRAVRYIEHQFKIFGIGPYGKSYKQTFKAQLRVKEGNPPKKDVRTWNVIGYI